MFVQFIGFIAFLFLSISFCCKNKKDILAFQIFSNLFYMVHYLYLNGLSGALVSLVGIVRSYIFMIKEKYRWLNHNFILFVFILTFAVISIYTFDGIFSLLPGIAVIIYTSVLWNGNEVEIQYGSLINAILWLIYNIVMLSYAGMLAETLVISINIYNLIKKEKVKS